MRAIEQRAPTEHRQVHRAQHRAAKSESNGGAFLGTVQLIVGALLIVMGLGMASGLL